MGSALARAAAKTIPGKNITLCDANTGKAEKLAEELHCFALPTDKAVSLADFIFIGVKPQMLKALAEEIRGKILPDTILVSMAAGTSIEKIQELFGRHPIIRIMPNVACGVGEGMILVCKNELVTEENSREFAYAMGEAGKLETIPEKLIDAASAVTGCGPAYVFIMAEAMADGLVACGVPRDKAYTFVSQTILGSAKLMLDSDKNPSALKDSVTSPGGTTIEGVTALERNGFRYALIEAVREAYEKNGKI